ncbi:hypothetical protein [Vibrio sp. 1F255]|uniref:hypothetical protein n=1 Tax=Vibrio sp. 1F255 TaxID=3230009 RepID=UPI00352CA329
MSLGYRTHLCILTVFIIVAMSIVVSYFGIVSIGFFQDLETSTQLKLVCFSAGYLCSVGIIALLLAILGRDRLLALVGKHKENQE